MLDHVSIGITDREKSKNFYDAILSTIGFKRVADYGESIAYGPSRENPFFWLIEHKDIGHAEGFHCAFRAPDRSSIHAFHAAALSSGGTDNGGPANETMKRIITPRLCLILTAIRLKLSASIRSR